MKRRSSFVSNSSSCSFIVLNGEPERVIYDYSVFIIGVEGEREFGWGYDFYNDFYSKLNFAVMQAQYADNVGWFNMIIDVVKDFLGVELVGNILLIDDYENIDTKHVDKFSGEFSFDEIKDTYLYDVVYGYIDHNSNAKQGYNVRIFRNKNVLAQFLFSRYSVLYLCNDNTDNFGKILDDLDISHEEFESFRE